MITMLIPKTAKGRRPQLAMKPEYITIHSTGNPNSTARNEAMNVVNNHPEMQVSFHYVVDDKEIYNVIPDNEVAWHAGDGNGSGNRKSIGVEICESGDRTQAFLNAIRLVTELMKKHNIPIERVVQHNRWSGKDCPRILRNPNYIKNKMDWKWFIMTLKASIEQSRKPHWAEKHLDSLVKKGLINSPEVHRGTLDEPMTKAQIFTMLDRITDK